MLVSDFDYDLPDGAIAQSAIEPRDAARLLRVNGDVDYKFFQLPELLNAGDVLVVNRTRVRAARLRGSKIGSGGSVELLLLRPLSGDRWEALMRPSRRLRAGIELSFGPLTGRVVSAPLEGVGVVELHAPSGDVAALVEEVGEVPLPPYFHGTLSSPDRYQTVFAAEPRSAAAPTAALHFTPRLCSDLEAGGVEFAEVELDVGLDTFRPMQVDRVADHEMHRERFVLPNEAAQQISAARRRGNRVIAVGTTAVRTLETMATPEGSVAPGSGESNLFIRPGYRARAVDAVITNFHAPRTTLIALVAAFLGPGWRAVYAGALERGYRFLSFGDAMFIEGLRR